MNEWLNEWMNELMNECMNEWMNDWINEWMNEWVDEWMNFYWFPDVILSSGLHFRNIWETCYGPMDPQTDG